MAIDLAKNSFQVCGVKIDGAAVFNRSVSWSRLIQLLSDHPPCIVAMEACATSHYWGRMAQAHGHEVRIIPAIYVKPFVKRQKNDLADAAAIAEAASRPRMSFGAVKSAEKQARAVAFRTQPRHDPTSELLVDARPIAEFFLQVTPQQTLPSYPENLIKNKAVPCGLESGRGTNGQDKALVKHPRVVRHQVSCQAGL